MFRVIQRLLPQRGQNLAVGGMRLPQRLQMSFCVIIGWPQPGQKVAPCGTSMWHIGHFAAGPASAVPQLTQRRASRGLSVPQLGQGLYLLPQWGQKVMLLGNFLAQEEQ